MKQQQEDELLQAFRSIDESTRAVILKFTQGQAAKHAAKTPRLRVIMGGRQKQ